MLFITIIDESQNTCVECNIPLTLPTNTHLCTCEYSLCVPVVLPGQWQHNHTYCNIMASRTTPAPRLCHIVKSEDFDGFGFNLYQEKTKAGQFIGRIEQGVWRLPPNTEHIGTQLSALCGIYFIWDIWCWGIIHWYHTANSQLCWRSWLRSEDHSGRTAFKNDPISGKTR